MPGSLPTTSRENAGGQVAAGEGAGEGKRGMGSEARVRDALGASCISAGEVRELRGPEHRSSPTALGGLAAAPSLRPAFPRRCPPEKATSGRLLTGAWRKGRGCASSGTVGLVEGSRRAGGDRNLPELSVWASATRKDDRAATPVPRRAPLRQGSEPVLGKRLAPEKQKPGDVGSAPGRGFAQERPELGDSFPCKENGSTE